jgi:hypothetical protein
MSACVNNRLPFARKVYYRVDDMFVDDLQLTFLLTGLRYQSQLWILFTPISGHYMNYSVCFTHYSKMA